ncbi:type I restriction endonuclease subunit R [Marivirga arenosa]|uniref:Type I restriction enzyme endonuclease subunit n=1 Tax=Marivirga arenosa TaxID=3059076 RepID=A0AA51ZVK2_9BACT|nr:type I restriction endonuclease subunit R [Marivirga sp. BKB1-2]WNB17550.1 type I restriction endonuclease subunit R [Marivirga sp. BKB1-2]
MSPQSEAQLEQELIDQLNSLGYKKVAITDGQALTQNLKAQLEAFNDVKLSSQEFDQILNHLGKGNVFEKAKTLRDRFAFKREDGEAVYIQFFDSEQLDRNLFQVTHQITQEGSYKNRYDVTLLINGLPLVQIELKRRGLEMKEAFNQINRYQRHSFWSNHGLFQYVQLFVISNGVNTKYLANNRLQSFKQTFFWADEQNRNIKPLDKFTDSFLAPSHLAKMIGHYIVMSESNKIMMALRPYQYYAVEALIKRVKDTNSNGYIWHTTGSGKTLTSFKASQIIMDIPSVEKVVFVVDRKDLDYQTMKEFNSFKKDSVDVTKNTASLVRQFNEQSKLVLTTLQKLNNAIGKKHYEKQLSSLRDKKVVFIFDECHRSQFGETHQRIVEFFPNSQLFGFTGTPIFADNAAKNELGKRTTKDLFDECLHKYVITDAIRDQNVLKFGIEYVGKYKQKGRTLLDIEVEDIDRKEVIDSEVRLEKIVDYLIDYHDVKTHNRMFSSIMAVSSIPNLIKYYELFRKKREEGKHDLRVATIFSYAANEEDDDASGMLPGDDLPMAAEPQAQYQNSHTRDKLESFIKDYNALYQTGFTTKDSQQFQNYYEDLSKRLKEREKESFQDKDRLDILLVVNMFLTGFDAKMVNSLYVDKNLKYHGLIQAFSRTNRIINDTKSQGNILSFRNLKKSTDEAITLFSNKEAKEEILMPDYEKVVNQFYNAFEELKAVTPSVESVDDLLTEEDELAFVQAFRSLMRIKNVLGSYTDFDWEDMPLTEQEFLDYTSKYLDLRDKVKNEHTKEKVSILNDVDFELELIHRDEINVSYILKLLAKYKESKESERAAQKKHIMDLMGGEIELRSKRELIEKFIDEHLPKIEDTDKIADEFESFWENERIMALKELCDEENLDQQQFKALIDAYIYSEQEPLRDEVFECLDDRPSVLQARTIGERIITKMKEFVQVFVEGMRA